MAKAIISYDKDLPEILDRRPWEKPVSFLVKVTTTESGWRVDASGRRPSHLLLIPKLRIAVDQWRDDGYPGASEVTRRLCAYWFDEDHEVTGFTVPFRYHFCQREAIETLAYLVEVARIGDAKVLIDAYAEVFRRDLLSKSIEFQTTMDGQRQIRRYVPELEAEDVQYLPPEDLRRYAFKMATGSGKTWVMAMVWSHFHKKRVPDSDLSTNFLIVAPNVIVYQRLEKDFGSNRIFHELPLIPPEWRSTWSQKVILRGESTEPDPSGNFFLTNIHHLWKTKEFGFRESEVLVIHTDAAGEITKKDLEQARQVARDIDQAGSRIKAIVSVMMLREGWDVRAVSVVLGLRPFTARAEILPEQVIGRGLRLMTAIGPDRTQTLEVLGTRLTNAFADLFPIVRTYVTTRCFGKTIDIDHETIRSHLQRLELQEGITRYLARSIAELTVEKREIEFEKANFKLSDTKPFQWRRNLPPLVAERTVFNYVATYNDFERRFAQFLDTAPDVLRFASLGTTEQGDSGTQFRVDYLKPSGAIGFYHPDWVVIQQTDRGEGNWIIETKGRVWEGTEAKDAAIRDWCARVSEQTGAAWTYTRVDQSGFDAQRPATLAEVTRRGGEENNQLM